jgi:mono/diheme cytochrome c family protein
MHTWMRSILFVTLLVPAVAQPQPPKSVDFFRDIQPIFVKSCQSCHQGGAAPADLRLDSSAALLKGSISGKVVVPGKSSESLLVKRISDKSGLGMPPSGPLPDEQIGLISAWVDQGAKIDDTFSANVLPIFKSACYQCHSGSDPKAQLHLDVKSMALKGGASGTAIIPGNSRDSRLVHRVLGEGGEAQMPLGHTPLTTAQIATLRQWIDSGAVWPDGLSAQGSAPTHWAYVKPVRPQLPVVKDAAWVRNPVDRFILARLEKEGLKPSHEASKETLIRRLSLDLIGLPPTPAEVDAFVADTRPDAYERLVDRLFASPHYGERWATPWLDLARYGDSDGWTQDHQRPSAWPYRDWVIKALNANMPFDKFTVQQLAGDLLPNSSVDQKIATGFVRSSMLQTEPGTDAAENSWNAQIDRASTVGMAWMGSTIGCAECHNHKYDPFTQKQFYQMVAFFNNSAYTPEVEDPVYHKKNAFGEPQLDLPTPEQAQKRDVIKRELQIYKDKLNDSSPEFQKRQAAWEEAVLAFEKQWRPLLATKVISTDGTTLTAAPDGSILASGKDPDTDTYVLDAKAPLGEITAIRLEALPDPSLPQGGPGRDYYGNFMVHDISVQAGSSADHLSKVAIKEILRDDDAPTVMDDPASQVKQVWVVNAAGHPDRHRVQLLLIPEQPLKIGSGVLRVTIEHKSDVHGVNLGHFRVSATDAQNPKMAIDVPADLRPLLNVAREKRTAQEAESLAGQYRSVAVELAPVRAKIAELEGKIEDLHIPKALVLAENPQVPHPTTYVRMRGAFVSKGDLVEADVPNFLGKLPAGAPPNRLGLAEWLVSRDNPLTARVTVNHYWETIFGRGIVETTEDFGTQGSPPSHPELLDWLAVEFMDQGWNVKAIQRLIVTSNTYRQSSSVTPDLLERDPSNSLLARGPRFRVEAEMVRDIALEASGLLSQKMFGAPVKPSQPSGQWGWFPGSRPGTDIWQISPGEDKYRRALYVYIRRSVRYPSLTVFDAPSRETCIARRPRSDTPLQALTTLNDPAYFEAAQALAARILKEGGSDTSARAIYAFRLVTARKPTARELDTALSEYDKSLHHFEHNLKEAQAVAGEPDAERAAWTMFSNALLNLDEALTKE